MARPAPAAVAEPLDARKHFWARTAREQPRVLDTPEPVALFPCFGDSSLDLELSA